MNPIYEITVTKIKNRWHARLLKDDTILNEMACREQEDIGFICREMLRWANKLGHTVAFTYAARRRVSENKLTPTGKIWRKRDLDEERNKKVQKSSTTN